MKKKVLVVDNHPAILRSIARLLEKEGHQVLTAENGLLALDILKKEIPDVIITDLIMPNIDGATLCQVIRSMPQFKEIPHAAGGDGFVADRDCERRRRPSRRRRLRAHRRSGRGLGAVAALDGAPVSRRRDQARAAFRRGGGAALASARAASVR